jgi:hypothetical protein
MEEINSMFDLYNRKETGLSRSLAAIIYSDYRVLKKILKDNGFSFNSIDKKTLKVYFELTNDKNRYDIYCESENFAIIIETKIGSSIVNDDQRERYIKDLKKKNKRYKMLIQITQFSNQKDVHDKYVKIINILWMNILKIINHYKISINISEEFENYIVRSHNMKINDMDIWAVVVRGRELKRLTEENIYLNTNHHQPVFIGLREWDREQKQIVLRKLYPVKEILPPHSPRLRQYRNIPHDGSWVYIMNNPIILKDPVQKKFKGMRKSAIQIKFSEIGNHS